MVLRMRELSNNIKMSLYKQPKLDHIFNKRIFTKINIPKLTAGQEYHINLSGFRNTAGSCFVFITPNDSNIKYTDNGNVPFYIMKYGLDNVYITDATNKNIFYGGNKFDNNYNKYLIANQFKKFSRSISTLTINS
jgi:hypothetical protein